MADGNDSDAAAGLIARLIERMQEGERVVDGWPGRVLQGQPVDSNEKPTPGLVADIAKTFPAVGDRPASGHKFSTTIGGRRATLRFWQYAHHPVPLAEIRRQARLCFVWLLMLVPCNRGRAGSKSCVCDFLLLPDKRQYPSGPEEPVDKQHCNGGVSYLGPEHAQFCVYRQEELFKVFVHETFHAFAAHGTFPRGREAELLSGLHTRIGVEYCEVYGEAWARIILVLFSRGDDGVQGVQEGLRVESEHGWKGCLCVLPRVAAHADKRQPTAAFEYYCLAGAVMNRHDAFLGWCARHNLSCGGGVGFELRDPKLWLEWLGRIVREELGYAGYLLASAEGAQERKRLRLDDHCRGSARMSIHNV